MRLLKWISIGLFFFATNIFAVKSISIKMYSTVKKTKDRSVGRIIATDTKKGLLLLPRLHGLPPGFHGFHLHKRPSCLRFGKAAGGHWDPKHTGRHRGPYRGDGHKGDLPKLYFNRKGVATRAVLAPRLTVADLKGHALIIHQGGDNYSDTPEPLGGGGARIACGVVR